MVSESGTVAVVLESGSEAVDLEGGTAAEDVCWKEEQRWKGHWERVMVCLRQVF